MCVLSPSSNLSKASDIIYLLGYHWCILTLGLRGMQKHGSNIQSKLMGLVEGLVISCLVLVLKKRKK